MKEKRVLVVGSDPYSVRGGMVSVIKNHLEYRDWEEFHLELLITHTEGSKRKKIFCFLKSYIRLVYILLSGRADLLHLHVSERGSVYRKAAVTGLARLFKRPVILHHHGAEFFDFYISLPERKKRRVRRLMEQVNCNILLSHTAEKNFKRFFPNARTEAVANAVCVPAQNPYRGGDGCIVTLGRLGERKGTYDLIRAVGRVRELLPEGTSLWLCGDGEIQEADRAVKDCKIDDITGHVGWVSGEEKSKLLRRASIHVLPSRREVLPMSILETMAEGIPNISTSVASIPEVIQHGVNGYLIKPGDEQALSEYICRLCGDPQVRMEMSRRAYETVKKDFSMEACCSRIKRIYRSCLTPNNGCSEGINKYQKKGKTK